MRLFVFDQPGFAPVGVVGEVEADARFDKEREFTAAGDGELNLLSDGEHAAILHSVLEDRLTVGQHLKNAVAFVIGLFVEPNLGDEQVPLPVGGKSEGRASVNSQPFVKGL